MIHVALVSAYPTEATALGAIAALPEYEAAPSRGIWRLPAPYGGIVHLFSDEATESLTETGWTLVSSALPGDADATFLLDPGPSRARPSTKRRELTSAHPPIAKAAPPMSVNPMTSAEMIAGVFHATYETLAPEHGYKTREAGAVAWEDVPADNKALMVATVQNLLDTGVIAAGPLARHIVARAVDRG